MEGGKKMSLTSQIRYTIRKRVIKYITRNVREVMYLYIIIVCMMPSRPHVIIQS